MIKGYLENANECLDALISITKDDIENIKNANHSSVDASVKSKNTLIKKFENLKKNIDSELVKLASNIGNEELSSKLDEDTRALLADMRKKLSELHKINKEYARHVVAVKEFFDSLVKDMFLPKDDGGIYKARA